jgi:hypothetical protein
VRLSTDNRPDADGLAEVDGAEADALHVDRARAAERNWASPRKCVSRASSVPIAGSIRSRRWTGSRSLVPRDAAIPDNMPIGCFPAR